MSKDDMLVRIRLMVEIADLLYNAGHVEAARLIQDLSYKEHKAWKDQN